MKKKANGREIILSPIDDSISAKKKNKRKSNVVTKRQTKVKYEVEEKSYIIKCRPSRLSELIKLLNDTQKADVRAIGFGGLFFMKCWKYMSWSSVFWFIDNFNDTTRLLEFESGKMIAVTAADIEDLFLLPRVVGNRVESSQKNDETAFAAVETLKSSFGLKGKVTQASVFQILLSLVDGGNGFKILFVFYALSTFLAPTANTSIDFSLFKCLSDVEKISSYDWCTFVVEKLCKALKSCREKEFKNVTGCVLVLPLLYCHQFMWLGLSMPYSLPLVRHWTSSTLSTRLEQESSSGSSFLRGNWLEGVFPISGRAKKPEAPRDMVDDVLLDETNDVDCDEMDHVKDVEGGRIVSYKLPADEKDNTQIKEISKNAFHESFLLLKRDFNVITHYHMKRLDKLKRKSKEDKSDAPSCSSSRPAGSTQPMPSNSDEDMYDEAFFKELDDIMKKFCEMKNKTVDEYPKFDLLSQSPKVEEQNEVEVEGYEEHNEAEDVVVQNASEEKFAEEDDGRYTLEKTVHYKVEKFDKGVNVCVIDPMSYLAHDDMRISNDAPPFKSKFMSRNGRYLKGFSTLPKHIVDYCLHHDKAMMTE